jgi:aminopeptidase N
VRNAFLTFLLLGCTALLASAQVTSSPARMSFAVTHYDALIEPDIAKKSIKGTVLIRLVPRTANATSVGLDCGDLTVDSVREGKQALQYAQVDHRLRVFLSRPAGLFKVRAQVREIEIVYHGTPRRGIRFFPERMQVYTVFATSQWMICDDDPDQRATLRLRLVVPSALTTIGNGRPVATKPFANGTSVNEWRQEAPVPTYTFGFVAGRFHTESEKHGSTELRYLAGDFSDHEVRRIFRDTADMIDFYEDRAGVKYPGTRYTQVLAAGGVEQEMSGFTALRENYGREVLANERGIWLGAHELAHQWWGIMVGCQAWTHFWLNEGMATFMADAYKERRFGREEYLKEIEASRKLYEKVRAAGKDRSLVFPDWLHPTAEDRTLVYDKGAYVLHLLREEIGERDFWAGIRLYTRKYFGKSVTTADFQREMERASGKSLSPFFAKWVYLKTGV